MKSFSKNVRVLFVLLLLAICGGNTLSAAEEKPEDEETENKGTEQDLDVTVTFINFSDTAVQIYWIAPENPADPGKREQHPIFKVEPYETGSTLTGQHHLFSYAWINNHYIHYIDPEQPNQQVHILGEVDPGDSRPEDELESFRNNMPSTKVVACATTEGVFHIQVKPFWSPWGASRFLTLVGRGYFDGCALNRVVPNFLTQFGIGKVYEQRTVMRTLSIPDDPHPPRHPVPADDLRFKPGYMSFAGNGYDSRSNEVFIVMPGTNDEQLEYFGVNSWETPFGFVEPESLDVVSKWYQYGDMPPYGKGPEPQKIYEENGYDYLKKEFPKMSYINHCVIVPDGGWKSEEATDEEL
mmetsp:Transcript_22446/g.47434  ORF Transcript_22446/g.47434 Transcript_22446/m.47434 type:complete len:353 (+) Transcript_22446:37-1095(+)